MKIIMSVSVTMEVATTTAITQLEVTHPPAIMATNLTVMGTLVKVPYVSLILCAKECMHVHS